MMTTEQRTESHSKDFDPDEKAPEAMTPFRAAMIAEGVEEADKETQRAAWQYLVDSGLAWSLQGYFGRQAVRLIEAGEIHAKNGG